MKPVNRIVPLTNQQIRQKTVTITSLLLIGLVVLAIGFWPGSMPGSWIITAVIGLVFGLMGGFTWHHLATQQIPPSHAFFQASTATKAVVLDHEVEEHKEPHTGLVGAGDGGVGCALMIVELFLVMAPRSPTYHHYLIIQFSVPGYMLEPDETVKLRVRVDNDLYSRTRQGSEIEVEYAKSNPHVLLIGPEIMSRKAKFAT